MLTRLLFQEKGGALNPNFNLRVRGNTLCLPRRNENRINITVGSGEFVIPTLVALPLPPERQHGTLYVGEIVGNNHVQTVTYSVGRIDPATPGVIKAGDILLLHTQPGRVRCCAPAGHGIVIDMQVRRFEDMQRKRYRRFVIGDKWHGNRWFMSIIEDPYGPPVRKKDI